VSPPVLIIADSRLSKEDMRVEHIEGLTPDMFNPRSGTYG
jgi:hypothetical protein